MRLGNQFSVPARADDAWKFLNDVPSIVPCMPGAELVEVVGTDAWKAKIHVKIGPVALQFITDISRQQSDEATRRVVLHAVGKEARGRGAAEATIESHLVEEADETIVTITTDLTLQGAVAQYGRGIVADVSAQLTSDFARALAALLADQAVAAADGAPPPVPKAAPSQVTPIRPARLGFNTVWRALRRRVLALFRIRTNGSAAD